MKYTLLAAIVACALAMASSPSGQAQFRTGNDLERACSASDEHSYWYCVGYIDGATDALDRARLLAGKHQCVPTGTEAGQVRDVVTNYLKNHPANRSSSGAALVMLAIYEAWNCPPQK